MGPSIFQKGILVLGQDSFQIRGPELTHKVPCYAELVDPVLGLLLSFHILCFVYLYVQIESNSESNRTRFLQIKN